MDKPARDPRRVDELEGHGDGAPGARHAPRGRRVPDVAERRELFHGNPGWRAAGEFAGGHCGIQHCGSLDLVGLWTAALAWRMSSHAMPHKVLMMWRRESKREKEVVASRNNHLMSETITLEQLLKSPYLSPNSKGRGRKPKTHSSRAPTPPPLLFKAPTPSLLLILLRVCREALLGCWGRSPSCASTEATDNPPCAAATRRPSPPCTAGGRTPHTPAGARAAGAHPRR
jgi:hypothetical protein